MRRFVSDLAGRALGILDPLERKVFLQNEIRACFGFARVEILVPPEGSERFSPQSTRVRDILSRIVGILEGTRRPFLNQEVAREIGFPSILQSIEATHAFPIKYGENRLGLLVIDSTPRVRLGSGTENSLRTLTDQLALVLENSILLETKLGLQNELARKAQMVQLGEMTARIAHEIKNPLSSIKTIVQVMQEDASLRGAYSRDLALINNEIDRLEGSISQLLNFARPDQQEREKISLRKSADSVLNFLRRDLEQQEVRVENEIPAQLPAIESSPTILREVILNLILNAVQAGGRGTSLRLLAWTGAMADGSEKYLLLVVEDDGPGIPAEMKESVFTPFFTTRQRGTGLGLAIVKRNVEHMGGSITMESPARNGHGTRFLIYLPLAVCE